jgi:hypothetical protein
VAKKITLGDAKNGKESAPVVSAIHERIECFPCFWFGGSQALPNPLGKQLAIAPNKHQLSLFIGKIARNAPPFLDHLRGVLQLKLVCEAKEVANSK